MHEGEGAGKEDRHRRNDSEGFGNRGDPFHGRKARQFLEYIEENLEQEISLEEMAARAGVSKTEVLRCFHKTLQTTPYSYVMEVRLSKAADLLAQTGLSVGEIASRTGFNQQSYFGKRFKEKTGMTPLEYRKRTRT